jgi:hypothetical protein
MPWRPCAGPSPSIPCPAGAPPVQVQRGAKQAGRCPDCQRAHNARKRATRPYDHAERLEHEALIAAWVQANGWVCPGTVYCGGKPHPSTDLTVDHHQAVAHGAPRAGGAKRVVCRPGNSSAGATIRRGIAPRE